MIKKSWFGSIEAMKHIVPDGVPGATGYIFTIGNERVDYLIMSRKAVTIDETQGWWKYAENDRLTVITDLEYQSANYLYKFGIFSQPLKNLAFMMFYLCKILQMGMIAQPTTNLVILNI